MLPTPILCEGARWDDPCYERIRNHPPDFVWFCKNPSSDTTIMAISGVGTADDNVSGVYLPEDVILYVDAYQTSHNWIKPGDLDVSHIPKVLRIAGGLSSESYHGCVVCFADGEIWHLSETVPLDILSEFFTVHGAANASREQSLGAFCTLRLARDTMPWMTRRKGER